MPLNFDPPLLNSANPWATTHEDLKSLYNCPFTGAVTTRTSLLEKGFSHDPAVHQHCFVNADDPQRILSHSKVNAAAASDAPSSSPNAVTSLNTYGYSPHPLSQYVAWAVEILKEFNSPSSSSSASASSSFPNAAASTPPTSKPFIFSVTGSPLEVSECYAIIASSQYQLRLLEGFESTSFFMEINLSCPNIAGQPPPGYSAPYLEEYLSAIQLARTSAQLSSFPPIAVGIKTPPYTYSTQFTDLIAVLLKFPTDCPIAFITAVNTLGSSLLLAPVAESGDQSKVWYRPALASASGTGLGGLAGSALHPLALGNVATFRRLLDGHANLRTIEIIGIGGVSDKEGYERMRSVGAVAVGVGTALGVEGVDVFKVISRK